MAELVTPEQHMDRQPPTTVIQATTLWEAEAEHATLQEVGLGVNLPVRVCCYTNLSGNYHIIYLYSLYHSFQQLWTVALQLTQPMAELVILLQRMDRQPPTVVTQATT